MNSEANRLNTFSNWPPGAPVDPIRIAKGGFFYTGEGTEVECFSCGGKISEWNYGDQVMLRHRRLEPNCPFVVNPNTAGNEPLVLDRGQREYQSSFSEPSDQFAAGTAASDDESVTSIRDVQPTDEDQLYKSDALRLVSFANWQDNSISRESLVTAGFYHAGEGRLRCAWCGGELAPFRNLGSLGAPLDIHRRYFPRCEYVLRVDNRNRAADLSPPITSPHTPQVDCPRNSVMSEGAMHNASLLSAGGARGCRALGVVPVPGRGARHAALAGLAARLATYAAWPAGRPQAPRALAEAGFFYAGQDDQVCCFYCAGGLGKWEAGDEPWAEHARWFPACGYVQLVKGADFVAKHRSAPRAQVPAERNSDTRLQNQNQNPRIHFPVIESQVEEHMEGAPALVALGAGLDAARVRRALRRRLQTTGLAFASSEALIDAVLDEQLNEESWSVTPNQRFARDILAEALREFAPAAGIIPSLDRDQSHSESSSRSRTPTEPPPPPPEPPLPPPTPTEPPPPLAAPRDACRPEAEQRESPVRKEISLEEENRQLREARMCKVCMDSEVSVVFLPCGHLVSCARCGAALASCPLCRSAVRALVRAYLA